MRTSLKVQFILMAMLLVLVSVVGSTYFFIQQERDVLLREMTRRGVTICRNLGVISTDSLIAQDSLALATYVSSVMKNEGLVYAMILNDKHKIMAHNRIENVGKSYVEPQGLRPLISEDILIQPYRNDKKEQVIDIAIPINLRSGMRIGSAHIGMAQSSIDQYVNQAFRDSVSIAAGLLIIGMIIAVLFTNWMFSAFGELVKGARAVGEGNLNYKLAVRGGNELAQLARTFNEMTDRLKDLYIGVLRAMAKALESRDPYASGHDLRVADYAALCAEYIHLSPDEIANVRLAAQVQNLGNISVPDVVLENTGKLSGDEYEKLKKHTVIGAEILGQIPALQGVVKLVLHHHERFDGKGYPDAMAGKAIPLGARILAVADAFDAMTSAQKHRQVVSEPEALEELKKGAGTQFDPEIVKAFIEALSSRPRRK